jgi:hypothetical protein
MILRPFEKMHFLGLTPFVHFEVCREVSETKSNLLGLSQVPNTTPFCDQGF